MLFNRVAQDLLNSNQPQHPLEDDESCRLPDSLAEARRRLQTLRMTVHQRGSGADA